MEQQDSLTLTWSKILVPFKMVHPKYGGVCIIHRINMMCLPRWLIFCHQLTKKHYSYIEANMDLLRHKL